MSAEAPAVGGHFHDVAGRELTVDAVNVGAQDGREVVGWIVHGPEGDRRRDRYACGLLTWADVWRDRAPRRLLAGMKVGG